MKIQVTAEDIANGKREDCNYCPIALAVGRATHCKRVSVGRRIIMWDIRFVQSKSAWMPSVAKEFINVFDAFGSNYVSPFEFEVEFVED